MFVVLVHYDFEYLKSVLYGTDISSILKTVMQTQTDR